MECNKVEATRAKVIAEGKLLQKDYSSAKSFALKAQTLYPQLDGISQLLATLDVSLSAENKINGEVDWYGMLDVNPSADDETIKKQYRKLALMLHPDKNNIVGADGAFKLVSEAGSLLSDKAKRSAYDQRRGCEGFRQKTQTLIGGPLASYQNKSAKAAPNATNLAPIYRKADTFWTICSGCKMHYEFQKLYCNHTLMCPNCEESFVASETAPPPTIWTVCHRCNMQHEYLKRFCNHTLLCINCREPFMASETARPIKS